MKKSTIFIILAISTLIIGISTTNLILLKEYNKKNIHPVLTAYNLPDFSHIVEIPNPKNSEQYPFHSIIINHHSDKNAISHGFYEDLKQIGAFEVKNDTLYISLNEPETMNVIKFELSCKKIQSITLSSIRAEMNGFNNEEINLSLKGYSDIVVKDSHFKVMKANLIQHAALEITEASVIDSVNIDSKDRTSLTIRDAIITKQHIVTGNEVRKMISTGLYKRK